MNSFTCNSNYFRMSAMDTDMITISRYITEQQRKSGGSGEFTQLTNGIVSGMNRSRVPADFFSIFSKLRGHPNHTV